MRQLFSGIILILFFSSPALASTTYTTNYSLSKPSDGSTTWGTELRSNFDTIDSQLYTNSNSITNHTSDTTAAHAATAISATSGSLTCTSADDVQEFLDCLDTQFGSVVGGAVVLLSGAQTIAGVKTFTSAPIFSGGMTVSSGSITLSPLSTGVVHSTSGLLSSSNIVNADVDSAAAITRTKIASGTASHVLINDGSGVMSSEAQLTTGRGGTGISTSSSTGVPSISSGTWSVNTRLTAGLGGTNIDTSASTGVPSISSGTWSVNTQLPTSLGGLGGNFGSSTGALSISSGTVTAGTLGVSNGGTGITSGTSGGIPYFSGSTTIASSSAIPSNALVVGGGAGVAPSPLPTGTPYQPLRIPSSGGAPAFGALDISQSTAVTGALAIGNGGTGQATKAAAFDALSPMTTLGDSIYGGASGTGTRLAGNITTTKKFLAQTGNGSISAAPSWQALIAPTVQKFTSGSGTYTTPAGVLYIRVTMVGGGGGGGGSGTGSPTDGGTGGNSTFGSSLLVANGGSGGTNATGVGGSGSGRGGAGGSASLGTGPIGFAGTGSDGSSRIAILGAGINEALSGMSGGCSMLGGNGRGGADGEAGGAGATNSGSGGGGAGGSNAGTGAVGQGAAGGGSGGGVSAIITSPSATYSYAVGASGSAGSAGTSGFAGGAGGSGLIIVEEHYQ